MVRLFLPKRENQNSRIVFESVCERLLNLCLSEVLVKASLEPNVQTQTNNLGVVRSSIFMESVRVGIRQELRIILEHLALVKLVADIREE